MKKQQWRWPLLIIGIILLIGNLFTIDYTHLFTRNNLGTALAMISNLLLILGMLISLRYTSKRQK